MTSGGGPVGPAGVTIQATLIRPDNSAVKLNATSLSAGVFKVSFTVPKTGSIGTYTLLVIAHMAGASDGTALVTFEVKQSWLASQGPAITAGVISTVGVLGAVAIAWRKGYFKQQSKNSFAAEQGSLRVLSRLFTLGSFFHS